MQRRAQHLPADSVPPENLKLLPLDQLLDKIQVHKSATPVPTPQSEQEASANLDVLRVNGVVLDKSSKDEMYVSAQCNAALNILLDTLKATPKPLVPSALIAQRLEVTTGN